MPEKKRANDHKGIYTAFTAFTITLLITLWNVFANEDRIKDKNDAASILTPNFAADDISASCTKPSIEQNGSVQCVTVARTRSS